jgi:hypothetical protein
VQSECDHAGAKCLSAADECRKDFPNPGDLDNYVANLKSNYASSDFGPNAKRNFAHWLDGSGTELEMPSSVFENHDGTRRALLTHRDKFIEGAQKRLADGRMKPGVPSDVIPYTGLGKSFSMIPLSPHSDDLAWSVGGFQLCSNVRMTATLLEGKRYGVKFVEWKCQAFDCYNWDPGKGIGSTEINDTKLCCVENAGKAKHFMDHSTVWGNKDAASLADGEVLATVPGGASPVPSPAPAPTPAPKKDDDR